MISAERIYLTKDGEAVREGDPGAVELLVGEGCEINDVFAAEFGLPLAELETTSDDEATEEAATEEQPAPARRTTARRNTRKAK